jgi:hypothetical protein
MICKNTKTKTQTPGKKRKQNKAKRDNTTLIGLSIFFKYFTIYWPGSAFLLKFEKFS